VHEVRQLRRDERVFVSERLNQKKRHHYISQTYLRGFCNEAGKVCAYSKDKPAQPWWAAPETIAYENYYYSQPTPDGGQDNNGIEDYFSSIENDWPALVSNIEQRKRHEGGLDCLMLFATMHRVRVPAARDAIEKMLAETVRMTGRHLNDLGELPPPPGGLTFEYLDQHTVISIDPHKSIHAMADLAKGMEKIARSIGYEIIENRTSESFITSDNPVIYFDPTATERTLQPYNIDRRRMDIEFMFPITPRFLLWGHSSLRSKYPNTPYRAVTDKKFIKRANVMAAQFGHRMLFSHELRHQPLAKKYANRSPVLSATHLRTPTGRGLVFQKIFGKREAKPKWGRS
jgi:hypothetical protein